MTVRGIRGGMPLAKALVVTQALILGAVALNTGCGGGPTAPPPVTQGPPAEPGLPPPNPPSPLPPVLGVTRLLAFGDSMTAGTTSAPVPFLGLTAGLPQSYPFKLLTLLTMRYAGQTIEVANAGLAGRLAQQDRQRLADAIKETDPQVVLLMEGANDLNQGRETPNATITATVNALEDMVRDTSARGIPVLLATLPPQRPPKGEAASFVARFNDALKVMAARKGATIVDIGAVFPASLIGQDGLHPTETGYERFAEIFLDAIKAKFEVTSSGAGR